MTRLLIVNEDNDYSFDFVNALTKEKNINIVGIVNIENDTYSDKILETIKETFEKKTAISDLKLKQEIHQLLLKMKLHTNEYIGIPYLVDAVICCYKDPSLVLKGLDSIYAEVEKDFKYTVKIDNIRWRIDNIFRVYKKIVNIDDLCDIFDYYDIKKDLSPKYFMSLAIEYLDKVHK